MKKIIILTIFLFLFDYIFTFFRIESVPINIPHDIFHHHFLPNHSYIRDTESWGKYRIITNSLGFRDSVKREIDLNAKNRIILIGDSFIEGVLLDYEYTVAGLLEKYFNKKNIQVLNAGVSSYSPIIYYNKIKHYLENGLQFSHLVVFIDISDIEDEAIYYKHDQSKKVVLGTKLLQQETFNSKNNIRFKIINFLQKNLSISYASFKYLDDNVIDRLTRPTEEQFIDSIVSSNFTRDKWTINQELKKKYEEGINKSIQNMTLLKKISDENDINLSIVVYPWFTQIYHNDLNSEQVKIWENFSKKNDIQFINLFPVFINDKNKNANIYNIIKKDFIPYDVHWNKNGSKKVANYFIKNFQY